MYSKRQLEQLGEPLGDSVTRKGCGRTIYGGGGDSSSEGTSTTTQAIPAELKPLATAYTQKAINLSQQPFQAYSGQRFENLTAPQQSGIDATMQRATGGDPTVNAGRQFLEQQFSNQENPYLEGTVNKALGDVQGRVMSQFGGSNYGTTANQQLLARELGNVENQLRMGEYEGRMNRGMQGLSQALQYGNQGYQDAAQMLQAGQILQDQGQKQKDFSFEEFMRQQNLPYEQLAAMSGVFGSNLGGTSVTKSDSGGGK